MDGLSRPIGPPLKWGVTLYSGLSQLYFRSLLRAVIRVGELHRPGLRILDFGCGGGELKKLLPGALVTGYDIRPDLTEVPDWRAVPFDVLVANEVFYSFQEGDLRSLLEELKGRSPRPRLVVGISRRGFLNKMGMVLLGRPQAHAAARLAPMRELAVLQEYGRILGHRGVLGLADAYSLEFR